MVKVLQSFVRGPLEPHVEGFAAELLRRGYSQSSAAQHVCFIAHLDRWMRAEGVELSGLSEPVMQCRRPCETAHGRSRNLPVGGQSNCPLVVMSSAHV